MFVLTEANASALLILRLCLLNTVTFCLLELSFLTKKQSCMTCGTGPSGCNLTFPRPQQIENSGLDSGPTVSCLKFRALQYRQTLDLIIILFT